MKRLDSFARRNRKPSWVVGENSEFRMALRNNSDLDAHEWEKMIYRPERLFGVRIQYMKSASNRSLLKFKAEYSFLEKEIPPTEQRLAGFAAPMKG